MEGDGMVVCPNVFYTVLNPLLWAGSQVSCVIITISVILNHINYLFLYAMYIYIYNFKVWLQVAWRNVAGCGVGHHCCETKE